MAYTAQRGAVRPHGSRAVGTFSPQPSGRRHPLIAVAMVLPLAVLFAVVFGGWEAMAAQASSVAGLLGR